MPKIRRAKLPEPLLVHLLTRVRQRNISEEQVILLARWLDTNPEVPESKWFKKFSNMIVCGEGELIKTFLQRLQKSSAIFDTLGQRKCDESPRPLKLDILPARLVAGSGVVEIQSIRQLGVGAGRHFFRVGDQRTNAGAGRDSGPRATIGDGLAEAGGCRRKHGGDFLNAR